MTKIVLPSTGPEDWRRLLADPAKQWKRGYSAMAAALSWEAAKGVPPEISAVLGDTTELLLAVPEHQVPLPGGGRASQCDVFALVKTDTETCALAVEAKVNEPFGPTIGEWMTNASPGKVARLDFILGLLGLGTPPPATLRYQLFHRTAAAVVEAGRFKTDRAAMIVQSFSAEHRWFADFDAFAQFLGVAVKPGGGATRPLPNGLPLTVGWAVGSGEFV